MRIDQPGGDGDRARSSDSTDSADTLDAVEDRDAAVDPDAVEARPDQVARAFEYRATVDVTYRAYAIDQAYGKIREVERGTVTPAMRRIEAEDPDRYLAGLENSLKGKDRLTEKVEFDVAKKGRTVDQALSNVKDAIRYTFCYNEADYTEGVNTDCNRLAANGFGLVERQNSWDKNQYKGVNSRWLALEDGQLFEVQFRTQASLDAKEETHWAYEKLRVSVPTQAEQRELEDYQTRIQ